MQVFDPYVFGLSNYESSYYAKKRLKECIREQHIYWNNWGHTRQEYKRRKNGHK